MAEKEPVAELQQQLSSDGATATPWAEGRRGLEQAQVYWLSTVRPDGRPHVTPVVAVWLDGALYFTTGPTERKVQAREVLTFRVTPSKAFAYGRGERFSATRWRF